LTKNLTVNPIQAATQRTGDTALVMLLVSLACSPAVSILGIKGLLKFRRTLGLYAFFYAGLHFSIFLGLDYAFNLSLVWADFAEKRFILVGFLTGLILLVLAVTSFQWWMIRLRKGWKRLHRLVYLAGVLAVLHYLWAVKADIRLPLLAGGILLLLLLLRLPPIKRRLIGARQRWAAKFQLL
jgi:sulfoxide reductase heme-binding subunit YedZ